MDTANMFICPVLGCCSVVVPPSMALSRSDNKTSICPSCGVREGLQGVLILDSEIKHLEFGGAK